METKKIQQKKSKRFFSSRMETLIAVSLLVLLQPIFVIAEESDNLNSQLKQQDLRIEILQEDIANQEKAFLETKNSLSEVRLQIETIESALVENEIRISQLEQFLQKHESELLDLRENLSESIRGLSLIRDTSSAELLFQNENLSDAIFEINFREKVTKKISDNYLEVRSKNIDIQSARDQLELTKLALVSSRLRLDVTNQTLAKYVDNQQENILHSAVSLEAVTDARKKTEQKLFAIAYDMVGKSINFDEATFFAKNASLKIKEKYNAQIPASLLLALVKQESNFGSFLGKGNYKNAMCSDKQISAFESIAESLDLNPDLIPVSQPAKNQSCGGAMGYAQFLPLTWLGYANEVSEITGNYPPSPWDPEDAFMAVALKLFHNGAGRGSTYAEIRKSQWEALMTYFSGSRWRDPEILKNISWYGDNILAISDSYAVNLGQ